MWGPFALFIALCLCVVFTVVFDSLGLHLDSFHLRCDFGLLFVVSVCFAPCAMWYSICFALPGRSYCASIRVIHLLGDYSSKKLENSTISEDNHSSIESCLYFGPIVFRK
jgi:hypothetical protein